MTQKLSTLSQSPYFDDFDPVKDYIRVLFRPSYPVQARELTTLQTFLQEQISRFGDNIFKDGSKVTNGNITVSNDVRRLSLTGSGNAAFPSSGASSGFSLATIGNLEGLVITNSTGTVKARVVTQPVGSASKQVGNLFVKYMTVETFDTTGGYIYANSTDNPELTQTYYNTYSAYSEATLANIAEGVYYVKGVFVRVPKQTILVDSSSSTPSCNIGFVANETVVTQNTDATLFDNARGSSNEGSPGAHRLKIVLDLGIKSIDAVTDDSFYRVATLKDGKIVESVKISPEYASIMETLARRTFDESGHYTLRPFTQTVSASDSDSAFTLKIGPSKAYVKGYEVTKGTSTNVDIDKGLTDTQTVTNFAVPFVGTTSVEVTSVSNTLPGQLSGEDPFASTSYLRFRDSGGNTIGVARAYAINTEVSKGVSKTKLYFYDLRMFTVLTVANNTFVTDLATGNDVTSLKTRGYVFNTEGSAGIANGLTIVNSSGKFKLNQTITSSNTATTTTISTVTQFTTADITSVVGDIGSFSATVTAGTFSNSNSQLVANVGRTLKTTLNSSSAIMDNSFDVIVSQGAVTASNILVNNGVWDKESLNDEKQITKKLKFKYIKVKSATSIAARSAANYGWIASDREVSLFYPDAHRVYKVSQTSDGTFANARFARIQITTSGVIAQGSIIKGVTSGTEAIVALANSTSGTSGSLGSTAGYHMYEEGTGFTDILEVVYQKGTAFTVGESITVEVPGGITAFTYPVTFNDDYSEMGSDVTGLFLFDDGQRGEYYDTARLVRKENAPAPTNDIVVFFSYFEADATSNYFYSVDSYSQIDFFDYDVRFYDQTQDIVPKRKDDGLDLRNCIDFRLRSNTVSSIASSPFNFGSRSFQSQGRVMPNSQFFTDFEEYLGRIDMLVLDKDSQFQIKRGIPSLSPKAPLEVEDTMTLSTIFIPPAVRYPNVEVSLAIKNNRRYTMADIGELDTRIQRVEEAIALSLLESQALHDDVSGRTKSGFVVDDFSTEFSGGNSPADHLDVEFEASVDTKAKTLVPAQTSGVSVPMGITASTNTSTFFDGYVMKSFTEEVLAKQLNATNAFYINPFAVWLFKGELKLTPNEHNWFIPRENYFINNFGTLQPVSAAEFDNFAKIAVSAPGGRSTTVQEWIGEPTTSTEREVLGTGLGIEWGFEDGNGTLFGRLQTTTTQAQRTITTTVFDTPRAAGPVTRTFDERVVAENPADKIVPSITVAFEAKGLRPNTEHEGLFGGVTVLTSLFSDANGEIAGSFVIPANTFTAGTEKFDLRDVLSAGVGSSASASFRTAGFIDKFNISQSVVNSTTTSSIQEGVVRSIDFSDPVAQLFMLPIEESNGVSKTQNAIITSVDLWFGFVDVRPNFNKVIVEIRESVNGYPGGPRSIIGTSGFVNIDKTNQVTTPTVANKTNFKFLEPVVLSAGVEYAIVIKSPSDATTVFVATIGKPLLTGTGIHDTQPLVGGYSGSFFKSQNSSTWEADQNVDLTFQVNRAVFSSSDATVTFKNTLSNTNVYNGDIGAFSKGLCLETFAASPYVKVHHPNHGLNFSGALVTLQGLGSTALNGIPVAELQATHTVLFPTLHSYFVKATTEATASGSPAVPMFTAFATQCVVYDSIMTNFMIRKQEADEVSITMTPVTTNSINLAISGNKLVNSDVAVPYTDRTYAVSLTGVQSFDEPKIIRNLLNSTGNDLVITMTMKSGDSYSSPFFKSGTNFNAIAFRNLTGSFVTDSEIESLTTRATSTGVDNTNQEHASYIAAKQAETEFSAYVTRQIDVEIPADGFTVFFDAIVKPKCSIDVAYKARHLGDTTPFEEIEWIDFPASQQVNEDNYGPFSSNSNQQSFTLRTATPFEFTSFKVRLRMTSENEALIPSIKDLRIIADI